MGFNTGSSSARSSNNNQGNSRNDNWKAQGFLNIYLPTANGGRTKLGAIALKDSSTNGAKLLEWLNADEANADKLKAALVIEFRSAEEKEGNALVLPI